MGIYKRKFNIFTGTFDYVIKGNIVSFEEGVATVGDLPSTGNIEGDARITSDNHHLHIWDGSAWQDQGDVFDIKWATLEDKPSSSVANIDDAVSKKHSQNTDTSLGIQTADINMDTHKLTNLSVPGSNGDSIRATNKITESNLEDGIDKKHSQHTDTDLDATFELTFVKKLDNVNVLADISSAGADIEDAVSKRHSQNTDTALGTQSEDLDMGTHKIVNVVDPVNPQDVATRKFVLDSVAVENIFDYVSANTIVPYIANASIDIGSGDFITTGKFSDGSNELTLAEIKAAYDERGSQIAGANLTWNSGVLDVDNVWWDSLADIDLTAEYLIKGSGANKAEAFAKGANGTVLAINGSGYLSWLSHADWDDAVTKEHEHSNKTELDKLTDGDHDVRVDNPHVVTVDQLDLSSGTVASDIDDAIDKKHAQNTDIALRTDKLTIDASGHTTIVGEMKFKVYSQDTEPTLNADDFLAMWKDTSVSGSPQVYLIYRRGVGDQVSVELA